MILGLDVGGTHTDAVLVDSTGMVADVKVPTDSADLLGTVLTALEAVTQSVSPSAIQRAVLSTTLTTNAIVEGKTATVGMIVTAGPGIDPEHYRCGSHYAIMAGAIDHRGRELVPVDLITVRRLARQWRAEGMQHVGVAGKFSIRNPEHEIAIAAALTECGLTPFMGHRLASGLSFPRRIATTFLNATVYPRHLTFFNAVQQSLAQRGLPVPIHILKADGGTLAFAASIDTPAQTILSGPAASVMGAVAFAPETGDTLVLDIGGTTTDLAILVDRVPLLNPSGIDLGGYRTQIRSLETRSIGIGGDSAVRFRDGRIQVGPQRQGAPLAHGGPVLTPTDALIALGHLRSGDQAAARDGIARLALQAHLSPEQAAEAILDEACRSIIGTAREMVEAINRQPVYTVHALLEGRTVSPSTALILGGPAPLFARRLEAMSGMRVGVVPRWEVANAIGAALARTTCEVTLFCDTERGVAYALEEQYQARVERSFSRAQAVERALALLRDKALACGAASDALDLEIIEELEFNMVRGFNSTGKNIRVKAQVRPGLIPGAEEIADVLASDLSRVPLATKRS